MTPGSYTLALSYPLPVGHAVGEPVVIGLRRPTDHEQERLRRLSGALALAGSWGRWTTLPVERSGLGLDEPIHPDDPLRFNLVVRRWRRGGEQVWALESALGVLSGIYAPEREALRAEGLVVTGNVAAGVALADTVARSCPGLRWWTDSIKSGLSSWTGLRLR